jgi:hypothetical protein
MKSFGKGLLKMSLSMFGFWLQRLGCGIFSGVHFVSALVPASVLDRADGVWPRLFRAVLRL